MQKWEEGKLSPAVECQPLSRAGVSKLEHRHPKPSGMLGLGKDHQWTHTMGGRLEEQDIYVTSKYVPTNS